eukprot:UN29303
MDYTGIIQKIPSCVTHSDLLEAKKIWESIDEHSTGVMSISEFVDGLTKYLDEEVFILQQAANTAFEVLNGKSTGEKKCVRRFDFLEILSSVRRYIQLWSSFVDVDTNDNTIDFSEFNASLSIVEGWGVTIPDSKKSL